MGRIPIPPRLVEEAVAVGGQIPLQSNDEACERIWTCKIGGMTPHVLSPADPAMRDAVEMMFKILTGVEAEFTFSGWGGELTEGERAVVEDRLPSPGYGHTFNVTTAKERDDVAADIPHFIHKAGDSVTITAAADIEEPQEANHD